MLEVSLKFWVSVSLNLILAAVTFYHSNQRANIQNYVFGVHSPDQSLEIQYENATENYLQFPIDLANATAVFNSVYGAGREKDSNLNPVGVNFFPAYIPPNTLMYHSREEPNIPESFEWLAMDYEFSYSFARFTRGKSRGGPHKPPKDPGDPGEPGIPGGRSSRKDPPEKNKGLSLDEKTQKRDHSGAGPSYLFTFRNKTPLNRLILLDGASAAKSSTGEMDQQMILSQQKDVEGYVDEEIAANNICNWGKSFGLQGVIRLEVGFEIILCDFHKDIELVSNVTLSNVTKMVGFPYEPSEPTTDLEKSRTKLIDRWQAMSEFEWMQAGGRVNNGDGRILIDYANMVTPLNKTWVNPDPYQRRINKLSEPLKSQIITQLENTISKGVDPFYKTDWPLVIGAIVEKFSPMLVGVNATFTVFEHEANINLSSALKNLSDNLSSSTFNFVRRYTDGNAHEAIQGTCARRDAVEDYVHNTFAISTTSERLIYSSVYRVTSEIVSMIFDLFDLCEKIFADRYVTPSDAHDIKLREIVLAKSADIKALIETLKWSSFIRCTQVCDWNEVCAVPGWGPGPMGWRFGSRKSLHFENGSYRINNELECINVDQLRLR
ncbi:hypothetical protein OY671_000733 [Metschnikowia pulcherrima]|nr:hypothetical protein OY671_000733 [Metschnikowia pulcherrima]